MAYYAIAYEKHDHLVRLSLARPESGNLVNQRLAHELYEACQAINEDDEVRVVILTAEGNIFSLGLDLAELLASVTGDPPGAGNPASIASRALASLQDPVIAALAGDAFGAGLELALACDIRIASPGVRLGFPETSLGLIPGGGGTQRLPRLVGRGKALDMILTAEPVDAQEAYRLGLVNELAPAGEVMRRAEEVARSIAGKAPIAVRYAKEAVSKGLDFTLDQGLRLEADLSILLQTTRDREEGIKAFLEKRTAQFRGT